MKFTLSLCVIWTLLNTGEALQCHICRDGYKCTETFSANCSSSEELCTTAAFKIHLSANSTQYIMKTCLPAVVCNASTDPLSLNLGFGRVVGSVKCCNTDLCNSQTLPIPADPESNGLQCYSCDSSACRNKVQCVGVENRCFNGSVNAGPITPQISGCVSANVCKAVTALSSMIDPNLFPSLPTCCEGNLCNSALAAKLSVFPLLFGLMSFTQTM